jgi:hypothetical protein
MDIGEHFCKHYLLTVDLFLNYPPPPSFECGQKSVTQQIINATIGLITHFSVPKIIYSDGGPHFLDNGKFEDFCKEWGVKHVSSSPYMPQSNGIAEECVK